MCNYRQFGGNVGRGRAERYDVFTRINMPRMGLVVPECKGVAVEFEYHHLFLSRCERHATEILELLVRAQYRRILLRNIQLYDLRTLSLAGIPHLYGYLQRFSAVSVLTFPRLSIFGESREKVV